MIRDGDGNQTCQGFEDSSKRSRICGNDKYNEIGSFYRQIKNPLKRYRNRWQRRRNRHMVKQYLYAFNQKS